MVDKIDITVIAPTTSGPRLSLSQGTASMQIERVAEMEAKHWKCQRSCAHDDVQGINPRNQPTSEFPVVGRTWNFWGSAIAAKEHPL